MEDSSQGSRRTHSSRPESRGSNNTKMTSTASDGSVDHLPQRTHVSSLLQERLRERKSESARQSRRMSVDMDSSYGHSSPTKTPSKEERRPSSSGISKVLGVKQIEEQVSNLHKQNFDLKLELYHRRQRQETLEARLEALERQVGEQAELQEVNEQLLAELEKRDQAVEEAVGIIVTLENKVEVLENEVEKLKLDREHVRAIDAEYETKYFQANGPDIPSSPPEPEKKNTLSVPNNRLPRMPSFLSENSEGTEALRSLYLPHNRTYSNSTLPKLQEESIASGMNSPRLSNLSESSFVSIYGEKVHPNSPEEPSQERNQRLAPSAVEKWVDDRPLPIITPPRPQTTNQFRSITRVMESPLQRLEKLEKTLQKHNASGTLHPNSSDSNEKRKSRELKKVLIQPSINIQQQGLPPTPDTISTSTLRHYQNSDDALRVRNGTFFNSTSTFTNAPSATHSAYQSAIAARPRSAGETVTSKREGRGWDTETHDDLTTDVASISSLTSDARSYSMERARPSMIEAPDLFTFGGVDWERERGYNNEPSRISSSRWEELRRSSMVGGERRSDDMFLPPQSHTQHQSESFNGGSGYQDRAPPNLDPPVSSSTRYPPDRRSSIGATMKLRKSNPNSGSSGSSQAASPNPGRGKQDERGLGEQQQHPEGKKSKLSALRIFMRNSESHKGGGELSPGLKGSMSAGNGFQYPAPVQSQSCNVRSAQGGLRVEGRPSHLNEAVTINESRATPPPIRRNRVGNGGTREPYYRPSSAGSGQIRRVGALAFDGAAEERERQEIQREFGGVGKLRRGSVGPGGGEGEGGEKGGHANTGGGGRKWGFLGRTGSTRRN